MAKVGTLVTTTLAGLLRSEGGVARAVAALANAEGIDLPPMEASQILAANLSTELTDRTQGAHYPQICVYCEKISNRHTEKFRRFSGKAFVNMEVRLSQERADGIEQRLQFYVEAVTNVLEQSRGELVTGIFYSGAYEIKFGNIRHGGKNFLQVATVAIELDVSQD